jgi:hypothetical protein
MAVLPGNPGVTVSSMYEFDAVSVSTYEAASLAAKLTEKSADGWEVVAIVPAGSDITAYVKRTVADAAASSTDIADSSAAEATPAADVAGVGAAAASEPAGWGTAPANTPTSSTWGSNSGSDTGSSWGTTTAAATDTSGGWGSGATPAAAPTAPAQPATPSVPAGWYHDPAGRFELRYWDGSAWTEHVSRAGQQYTDPPVA